ncbi:hypothetical protein GE09DRAFT_1163949 [Coniochaeta sp. 2T2.1]|nr:hypothetical protein GE09DRAFT_1163949 [Coniochaeta sp. 2T2.1]
MLLLQLAESLIAWRRHLSLPMSSRPATASHTGAVCVQSLESPPSCPLLLLVCLAGLQGVPFAGRVLLQGLLLVSHPTMSDV